MTEQQPKWLTVNQLVAAYPCFAIGGIRWIIFHEKTNGFDRCVRRVGRKVLIDVKEFEQWVDGQKD